MKEYRNVLYAVYISFSKNCPKYFDEIYVPLEIKGIHARPSCQKLKQKTSVRQKALSYVGPSLWNNLDKTLKTSTSLKCF